MAGINARGPGTRSGGIDWEDRMAWNEQKSRKRVDENDFQNFEINVADLSRTMDFANLGTKDVRRAQAAHIYADIRNLHDAVADAGADKQKQRKLVRAASTLRRVQSELLRAEEITDDARVGRIQLQAARLHALCYKPYDDESERALRAVVMGLSLNSYIYEVFNPIFEEVRNFQSMVGIAGGTTLIANIGFRGDRERICLGTAANLAAKMMSGNNSVSIAADIYALLPSFLSQHFVEAGEVCGVAIYRAKGFTWGAYPEVAEQADVEWDRDYWVRRTEECRDALPLNDIHIVEAGTTIDVEDLTERNCKRTEAIAIYADLDGFTRHVQEAESDEAVVSLVRDLHMIRHEFQAVVEQDYPGLALQHQGDRLFAILHEPCGDDPKLRQRRIEKAVDVATGLQSSMEHILAEKVGSDRDFHVAAGLDIGRVLVTRLGKKGKREVVCLGPAVTAAERLQLVSNGTETRIAGRVFDGLTDEVIRGQFDQEDDGSYVAAELTFPRLDELREEAAASKGALSAVAAAGSIRAVVEADSQQKPWSK